MPKKRGRRSASPSKNWTVKELREYISEHVEQINELAKNYAEQASKGMSDKRYDQQIKKLQKTTGQKKTGRGARIIKGLRKKKDELLKQAKQFKSFFGFAKKTPPAKKFDNEKTERAYQTFTKNYGEMEREDYEAMVNVFGNINFSDWGYEANADNVVGNVQEYIQEGFTEKDIIKAMKQVEREMRGRGWTPRDAMIRLDEILHEDEQEE